jgi:hypothetical protein
MTRYHLSDIAIDVIVNADKIPVAEYIDLRYGYLAIDDRLEIINLIEDMLLGEGE